MKTVQWIVGWAVVASATGLLAENWTQWRGNTRDLITHDQGLLKKWPETGPQQLWQKTLGDGYSSAIVVDGVLYLTGNVGDKGSTRGMLYALDAKSGAEKWKFEYGPEWDKSYECARATPTYFEGHLYLVSGLGRVLCVNVKTGKQVWAIDTFEKYSGRNITWGIAENPLIYDNTIIVQPGGDDTAIVALNIKTGDLIWKSSGLSDRSAYCSASLMVLNGKRQVVTMTENNAVGVDAETGVVQWKYPYRNKYSVHPNPPILIGENRVFLSSGYNYGSEAIEIAGDTARKVWEDKSNSNHFQGFTLYKGRIYSSGGNKLSCYDPKDGRQIYTVAGAKKTSFCITPVGMITYDELGGGVMLVDIQPDAYSVISSFKVTYGAGPHWSSPVVADGVLYIRHGKVMTAFKIK